MITVVYRPSFLRQYKKLPKPLREEIREKIAAFRKDPTDPSLKAHKLKGRLQASYSFSVNYKYRIIYEYESKKRIALLAVGDHSIYE